MLAHRILSGRALALAAAALALAACTTVGGPGASSYFECSDGEMLKVTPGRNGAAVEVDGGPPLLLRTTPSVAGSIYENAMGMRLHVTGDTATWSGRTRQAPATCTRVAVPR